MRLKEIITLFRLFFASIGLLNILLRAIVFFVFWRMWASFSATWTRSHHLITFESLLHTLLTLLYYRLSPIFGSLFLLRSKLCARNSLPPALPHLLILNCPTIGWLLIFGGLTTLFILRGRRILSRSLRGLLRLVIIIFSTRTFIMFLEILKSIPMHFTFIRKQRIFSVF